MISIYPVFSQNQGLAPREIARKNFTSFTNPYISTSFDGNGSIGYAYNLWFGVMHEGPVVIGIPDADMTTIKPYEAMSDFLTGADMVKREWFGVMFESHDLVKFDKQTGEYTIIGNTVDDATGFAYDANSELSYISDFNGGLHSVDLTNGETTFIGTGVPGIHGIACDKEGNMFAISSNDSLYSINKATGNATLIGYLGYNIDYAQDIAFDRDNGILYGTLAGNVILSDTKSGLYQINVETGAAELLVSFTEQVAGFAIPYEIAKDAAPAAITDFEVTPDSNGALTIDFAWKNPNLQYNGDVLTELDSVNLYIDDILLYSDTKVGIGNNVSETVVDVSQFGGGVHTIKVYGVNSAGEGVNVAIDIFIGIDVEVSGIGLETHTFLGDEFEPSIIVGSNGVGSQSFDLTLTISNGIDEVYTENVFVSGVTNEEPQSIVFPGWTAYPQGTYIFSVVASDINNEVDLSNNSISKTFGVIKGCEHTLRLKENWVDGWTYNTISVTVDDILALDNVAVGDYLTEATFPFYAGNNSDIQIDFYAQGYIPLDCSWEVLDGEGNSILSGGNSTEPVTQNCLGSGCAIVGQSVTFNVDMNAVIANETFFPATDTVFLSGNMSGDWEEPGTNPNLRLFDNDDDGIYTLTITDIGSGPYEYKYFKNSGWNGVEWIGNPNRSFDVINNDISLNDIWAKKPVGIRELAAQNISVYPNPSQGEIFIASKEGCKINIYNELGQVIYKDRELKKTRCITNLSPGIFIIEFYNKNRRELIRVVVE